MVEPSPVDEPAAEQPSITVPAQRTESADPTVPPAVPQVTPLVPSTPPAAVVRRAQSSSRWPLRLAIIFGVLSLLCVGGLGVAYQLYDKATAPNRSAPDVVVDNYLQAFLVDRSNSEAAQYACTDQSGLVAFTSFRDGLLTREANLKGRVAFAWGPLEVTHAGDRADVNVELSVDTSGGSSLAGRSFHDWMFTTINAGGWRVCGATETS